MYRNLVILLVICLALASPGQAQAQKKIFRNAYSVLVVGDSLSIPLGERLGEYFKLRPGITFHRLGKVSSGLARPDFFDWEVNLAAMANRHKPDAVFIMIGTNDTKNLTTPSGSARTFGAKGWQKEYMRRGQRLLDICRKANPSVSIFWVGAPVMGRAQLDREVRVVNQALVRLCERNANCSYIDTRDVLADSRGRFLSHRTGENGQSLRLRAKDGVHVTKAGSMLLADRCLEKAIFIKKPVQSTPVTVQAAAKVPRKQSTQNIRPAVVQASATRTNTRSWFYSIQESSWATDAEASRRVRLLRKRGISAHVAKADLGPRGVWHRVMIGSFNTLQQAKREKQELLAIHNLDHALIMKIRGRA